VETQLAADVPRIRGDRIQLQQVLLNLLMNALEALSGVGDGPRVLVVRSEPNGASGALVTVRDSGPGLDPQHLDRLFETFYLTNRRTEPRHEHYRRSTAASLLLPPSTTLGPAAPPRCARPPSRPETSWRCAL